MALIGQGHTAYLECRATIVGNPDGTLSRIEGAISSVDNPPHGTYPYTITFKTPMQGLCLVPFSGTMQITVNGMNFDVGDEGFDEAFIPFSSMTLVTVPSGGFKALFRGS